MTKLRVLFNVLEIHDGPGMFARAKGMGFEAISIFGNVGAKELPPHFAQAASEFRDVCINLYHLPTYCDEPGWRESLAGDSRSILPELARLGLHTYSWMIEGNLYGMKGNALVSRFTGGSRFVDHFNAFYDEAHRINPKAVVQLVPYPYGLVNLEYGWRGWKDWWKRRSRQLRFDRLALNAHVGTWIFAWNDKQVYRHLADSIRFVQDQGHAVEYVEVGYPTLGRKPLVGGYGWGRERDQVSMLETCYRALSDNHVNYMQICEFIDPDPKGQIYESFFGPKGKLPRVLGIPVTEEAHWGLLRRDGSEKAGAQWVRDRLRST